MPNKDPHAYASRSAADIQEQNPKNSSVKLKGANKKPRGGFANIGGTESDYGKKSTLAGQVDKLTTKGVDVSPGPTGLGDRFRKLAKIRNTKTSYAGD